MCTLRANASEAPVTPPAGVEMIEPRGMPATGTHDDLYVRALSLDDGHTPLTIVTMDLLGLDLELVERVRQAVFRRCGLPWQNLMLTASHNHSAPNTISWGRSAQTRRDRPWESRLVETIASCVARSQEHQAPVQLAAGRAPVQIGYNRRLSTVEGTVMAPNPNGPIAPWVDVLRVDRQDGKPLALLYSHAAHAVAVHVAGTAFSADFPGGAAQAIRCRLGRDVLPMFAQGCCADINVEPLRGGYVEAERVGAILGEAAADAANGARAFWGSPFAVAVRTIDLPFEPFEPGTSAAILSRVREGYATMLAQNAVQSDLYNQRDLLLWAEQMVALADSPSQAAGLPFTMQGFALGEQVVVLGLSHEVFVEYQLYLQRHSPFVHSLVLGYTNGCADYIPTADAFSLGGYEVQAAPKLYGLPQLRPSCEGIVKENALGVLQELWGRYHTAPPGPGSAGVTPEDQRP